MKKTRILYLVLLITPILCWSQIYEPIQWSTTINEISETEYELNATATIDGNWHVYSQDVPEGGPIATSFAFQSNNHYLKKGNTKEEEGHTVDDPVFNMRIKYFEKKAVFKQRIKINSKTPFKVQATVEFMACNDTQCLPPEEVELVFEIK